MKFISQYIILLSMSTFGLGDSETFSARKLLTDWCSFKCGKANIACGNCKFSSPCESSKVSEELLIMHNTLRDKFASGEDNRTGGITAANMHAVSWDNDLAHTARCNLAQCVGMKHDKCRTTPKFPIYAGQNLFAFSTSNKDADCTSKTIAGVKSWYGEIKYLEAKEIEDMSTSWQSKEKTGHFTQLVWSEVTHIGCAVSKNKVAKGTNCYLACNYGPGGNVVGKSMFEKGEPCSKCPKGMECGSTYKNLCGNVEKWNPAEENRTTQIPSNGGFIIIFVLLANKSLIL